MEGNRRKERTGEEWEEGDEKIAKRREGEKAE